MVLRQGLRTWLLAKDSDPSVRLRVVRDLLDRPADDPAVVGAQREIGRKGWAAQILRGQHPSGQWVNPGTSALDLYRPKYVATNWRLLVLSDLGLTKKTPRVAKAMGLFLNRFSRTGDLGGPSSEVCITGNAVRMMARFGYLKDPRMKPAIEWLVATRRRMEAGIASALASGRSTAGRPSPPSRRFPPGRGHRPSFDRSSGARNSTSSDGCFGKDPLLTVRGSGSTIPSTITTTSWSDSTPSRPLAMARTHGCGPPSTASRRCPTAMGAGTWMPFTQTARTPRTRFAGRAIHSAWRSRGARADGSRRPRSRS